MDTKVIVSTYEELPRRRRPISHGASTHTNASVPRQAGRGCNRRALLLVAYAQQLRRRRRQQIVGPPLLEWSEWKAGRVAGGDVAMTRGDGRRSWCSRMRSCVRLWIRTFLRRARRIREDASCKK